MSISGGACARRAQARQPRPSATGFPPFPLLQSLQALDGKLERLEQRLRDEFRQGAGQTRQEMGRLQHQMGQLLGKIDQVLQERK